MTANKVASAEALCWAFMGACGGAGVTSLCLQTAHELSNSHVAGGKARVCLFDLDMENGACLQYLNLKPVMTHKDLQNPTDRMDMHLLKSLLISHPAGFDILGVSKRLGGNQLIDLINILRMLDLLSRAYDYVILDVPRLWVPWTQAAIGGADQFSMVCELDVPSIQNVQGLQKMLQQELTDAKPASVIINKYDRRSFRYDVTLKDASKALGQEPEAVIAVNPNHLKEAINRGELVGEQNSNSRYVKDVRSFCQQRISAMPGTKAAV